KEPNDERSSNAAAVAGRVYTWLARDRPLRAAAQSRDRGGRPADLVLALVRRWVAEVVQLVGGRIVRAGVPGILLSGLADVGFDVYGDLRDDFDHRRPAGRIFAVGAGRADSALVDGVGQGAGRNGHRTVAGVAVLAVGAHVEDPARSSFV